LYCSSAAAVAARTTQHCSPSRRATTPPTTCSKALKVTVMAAVIATAWAAGRTAVDAKLRPRPGLRPGSVLPVHPTEKGGYQHDETERDPVPRERLEV